MPASEFGVAGILGNFGFSHREDAPKRMLPLRRILTFAVSSCSRRTMKLPTLFLLINVALIQQTQAASSSALVLNPADLNAWELITPEHASIATSCWAAGHDVLAVSGKPIGYLQTHAEFKNFTLHAEWRWTAQPGNGGVLVHIASGPIDRNTWPRSQQIQLKHKSAGDLLPMAGATFAEPLSTPSNAKTPTLNHSAADSEKPAGEWNSCEVLCRDGVIEVTVNGVQQNRITRSDPASGHIGFQLEGAPFELRNVRIEPLAEKPSV